MKIICGLVLTVLLCACQTPQEKMIAHFKKTLESSVKDQAFKANTAVQLLDIQYLDKRDIGENEIDSIRLASLAANRQNLKDIVELEIKYANLLIDEASTRGKMDALNGKKEDPQSIINTKADIKMHTDRAKAYLDTIQMMWNEDSVTRLKMKDRANGGEHLYLVTYIQKSTIANHNSVDTLQAIFDKSLQLKVPRLSVND
jgi:hypothetical protein